MEKQIIQDIFRDFKRLKVIIIGDVMVDSYYWGKVDRVSPEAPVPVVSVTKTDSRLGGAANVALNVKALRATPILCSVIGKDEKGKQFIDLLKKEGMTTAGILQQGDRTTTVKTRIIGGHQQMLRVDEEDSSNLSAENTHQLTKRIKQLIQQEKADVIIFEDYDKGVITHGLIREVIDFANQHHVPTAVDPKKKNFAHYQRVSLFKPNLKELKEGLHVEFSNVDKSELDKLTEMLKELLSMEHAMVTLSEKGVYIGDGKKSHLIPAHIRSIADVSGAGDTVISVAALCLALKLAPSFIAALSNLAGGLVCEEVGVVPIDPDLLEREALTLGES